MQNEPTEVTESVSCVCDKQPTRQMLLLVVRRRPCAVSNHEAPTVTTSFETRRFATLLRTRG